MAPDERRELIHLLNLSIFFNGDSMCCSVVYLRVLLGLVFSKHAERLLASPGEVVLLEGLAISFDITVSDVQSIGLHRGTSLAPLYS